MSSIRSILEEVYNAGEGRDFRQEGTMSDSIDQALKEIEEVMCRAYDEDWYKFQSNLKELLK